MAKFNAATVVEALDWDFNPYIKAKGTVQEPTDDQIAAFLDGLKSVTEDVKDKLPQGIDTDDTAEVLEALDALDAAALKDVHSKLAVVFAGLCSDNPSAELLMKTPPRVRTLFYQWLQREVMAPEAAPAAGNAQVRTLRSAVGG